MWVREWFFNYFPDMSLCDVPSALLTMQSAVHHGVALRTRLQIFFEMKLPSIMYVTSSLSTDRTYKSSSFPASKDQPFRKLPASASKDVPPGCMPRDNRMKGQSPFMCNEEYSSCGYDMEVKVVMHDKTNDASHISSDILAVLSHKRRNDQQHICRLSFVVVV